MKITSFHPMIVSKNSEELIKLFEDLGFEKRHTKTDIEDGQNVNVTMKDSSGFRVDVASSDKVPHDRTSIRINVDDFDEAYDFFIAHGFKNTRGDKITTTSSSVDTYLVSPTGFAITLCHHIKK